MTRISVLSFRPAKPLDRATGLIGYVELEVADLRLDGVTVRRTVDGRYALSYPVRRDRSGTEHSLVAPVTAQVGREIELEVLAALRAKGAVR